MRTIASFLALSVAFIATAFVNGQPPGGHPVPPNPVVPVPPVPPTTPAELPKLGGTWTIVGGERNAQKIPEEKIQGLRVVITADRITLFGRDNRPEFVASYKLNTAKNPNEINMQMVEGPRKGQLAQGIVLTEGAERMQLCYSPGSKGRPNEFRTHPGSDNLLIILQKNPVQTSYAGTWRVLAAETEGQPLPADRVRNSRAVFTKDTFVLTDPGGQRTLVAHYELRTGTTPNEIDLAVLEGDRKGQVAHGILAFEGLDRMRLAYAFGDTRPRAFRTERGAPAEFVYLLQREGGPTPNGPPGAAGGNTGVTGIQQTQINQTVNPPSPPPAPPRPSQNPPPARR